MRKAIDFAPTQFDSPIGWFPALEDQKDWLVAPVGQARGSGALSRSNFEVAECELDTLDPNQVDHEVHRFGHWGPGWFEVIVLRPDTPCAIWGEETERALEDYPVIDEEHFSQTECDEVEESWKYTSLAERVTLCREGRVSIFAARHDWPPSDDNGHIQERLLGW